MKRHINLKSWHNMSSRNNKINKSYLKLQILMYDD
jgi:hypothetical protein